MKPYYEPLLLGSILDRPRSFSDLNNCHVLLSTRWNALDDMRALLDKLRIEVLLKLLWILGHVEARLGHEALFLPQLFLRKVALVFRRDTIHC